MTYEIGTRVALRRDVEDRAAGEIGWVTGGQGENILVHFDDEDGATVVAVPPHLLKEVPRVRRRAR